MKVCGYLQSKTELLLDFHLHVVPLIDFKIIIIMIKFVATGL